MSEHEDAPGRRVPVDKLGAVAEPMQRGNLRFWAARGVTMSAVGSTGPRVGGGVVEIDDLLEFANYVKMRMPGATVLVHEYGLRALDYDNGANAGPKLDWDDWT